MRFLFFLPLLALMLSAPALAGSGPVEEILAEARAHAADAEYEKMISGLEKGLKSHPGHPDLERELARAYAWKGDFEKAEALLTELERKYPGDPDIALVSAYLAYYRQDFDEAETRFGDILEAFPEYTDARDGLALAQRARQAPGSYDWSFDTGFEWSTFERQSRSNWFNSFVHLARRVNEGRSVLHGRIERFDQFDNIDTYFEAGIHHVFGDRLYGYAHAGVTPHADFRPEFRLGGGGGVRLTPVTPLAVPVWATLDMRFDKYSDTEIINADPGLRIVFQPGWAASGKLITVSEDGAGTLYGWLGRLDGTLTEDLSFYAGYADAPETVAARTVTTSTWFAGTALALTPRHTVRIGYTRDDRENSYLRHALSASFSVRF